MGYLTSALKLYRMAIGFLGGWQSQTLSGALTLTKSAAQFQRIDPGGSNRNVTLPVVTSSDEGYFVVLASAADAAENLTVKDSGGSTIGTCNQSDLGIFYVDSSGSWQLFWMITGTIS